LIKEIDRILISVSRLWHLKSYAHSARASSKTKYLI